MIQIRRILVPTDFSPPALTALEYAKSLAAEFGSRLYLLHVITVPEIPWGVEAATYSWPTLVADLEKDARAQFEQLVPRGDAQTASRWKRSSARPWKASWTTRRRTRTISS